MGDPADKGRLEELFEAATCFVVPSHREASAIAYLEAAAAGLPVIGSAAGGSRDLIGDGGCVVDPADDDALFAAMREFADPEVAARVGAVSLRRAPLFTWRAVAERMARALDLPLVATESFADFLEPAMPANRPCRRSRSRTTASARSTRPTTRSISSCRPSISSRRCACSRALGYRFRTAGEIARRTAAPRHRRADVRRRLAGRARHRRSAAVAARRRRHVLRQPRAVGRQHHVVSGPAGRLLDENGARALVAAGFELGSHAMTHVDLRMHDDATLASELRDSRAAIEDVSGVPCRVLAYPFGAHDARVQAAAEDAGYALALGWLPGPWNPFAAPRLPGPTRHGASRLALKMTGVRRRKTLGPPPSRSRDRAGGVAMRALVTGGAGFIGSHLVDALQAQGDDVLVVDHLSRGHTRNLTGALSARRARSCAPT